jgi:hypothetical protein
MEEIVAMFVGGGIRYLLFKVLRSKKKFYRSYNRQNSGEDQWSDHPSRCFTYRSTYRIYIKLK